VLLAQKNPAARLYLKKIEDHQNISVANNLDFQDSEFNPPAEKSPQTASGEVIDMTKKKTT
jgi:hypothetical protein